MISYISCNTYIRESYGTVCGILELVRNSVENFHLIMNGSRYLLINFLCIKHVCIVIHHSKKNEEDNAVTSVLKEHTAEQKSKKRQKKRKEEKKTKEKRKKTEKPDR